MSLLVILFFFGLATGIVAKIKGSSFFLWFGIGAVLPFLGLLAALLYRWEKDDPLRSCPVCGNQLRVTTQVCSRCGLDLKLPEGF